MISSILPAFSVASEHSVLPVKKGKVHNETFTEDLIENMKSNIKSFHLKWSSVKWDRGEMKGNSWTDKECIDPPLPDESPGD